MRKCITLFDSPVRHGGWLPFGKPAKFGDGGPGRAVVCLESMGNSFTNRNRLALLVLFCSILLLTNGMAAAEKITFKRLPAAILKMDGKQVKFWDIYQAEKRGNFLLVQLGRRYLLLDTKEKEVFDIDPSAIESKPKGNEVVLLRSAERESRIESDGWSIRSVGPAIAIKVLLTAEGRLLELQLPQRPDERRQW